VRRALAATVVAAAFVAGSARAETQQVLLPGPTPYPTLSPPLVTTAPQIGATLTFRIHASSDQRITARVDRAGRVVGVRALQNLRLRGTGDYLIVVPAPVLDVRPGPLDAESQPMREGGAWVRRLEGAVVAVNPSSSPASVTAAGGVDLAPGTALIDVGGRVLRS
jgi:hypothetical protein